MKKFKFEFEQVLEYRNFEKKQAENELAKALAEETKISDNLKLIAFQYNNLKSQMKNTSDFQDVMNQNRYNNLLEYQKEELLKQLTQAKLITEERRKKLTEILKKTTALEKLKENELEIYKENIKSEEKKFLDDLNNK